MKTWQEAMRDSVVSGSITSVLSTAVLALCGKREAGSPFAPTNATSHWLWGDRAAHQDEASVRYTLLGYVVHHLSAIFWAVFYEKWFGDKADRKEVVPALAGGAAVAGLACFVDYKMTPRRLQPGYEMRLSRPSLFLVYTAVGVGLALGALSTTRQQSPS